MMKSLFSRRPWAASMLAMAALAVTAPTSTSAAAAEPAIKVMTLVGTPQVETVGGSSKALEVGAMLNLGDVITTDDASRVGISIGRSAEMDQRQTDLLVIGPKSRIGLTPMPAEAAGEAIGNLPVPVLVDVHDGIYQAITRKIDGEAAFAISAGGRRCYLAGADALGTYTAADDLASYMTMTGMVVVKMGKRKIKVRAGMVRTIAEGKVSGARALSRPDREAVVALTRIDEFDTSQPANLARADVGVKPPPRITNPRPWQYDEATNRHWNADHGHWHDGPPPEDKIVQAPTEKRGGLDLGAKRFDNAAVLMDVDEKFEYVRMVTSKGEIVLELDIARAPITVKNFLDYVNSGFYEGTIFHRVMTNFMVQGGGFTEDLVKKADENAGIENEWRNGLKNKRYTIAMARKGRQPNSATNQFFINTKDNPALDLARDGAAYAVFGRVVEGTEVVDAIEAAAVQRVGSHQHVPLEPIIIERAVHTTKKAVGGA